MKTFTYTEARQKLASLLDLARRDGAVQIRRRDGQVFLLQAVASEGSPLDVPGIRVRLRPGESREWLKRSREESAKRFDRGAESTRSSKTSKKPRTRRKGRPIQ